MRGRWTILTLAVLTLLLAAGCPKKTIDSEAASTEDARPQPPSMATGSAETTPPPAEVIETFPSQEVESAPLRDDSVDDLNRMGVLESVYFE